MSNVHEIDANGKAARRLKIARVVRRHLEDGATLLAACERARVPRRTFLEWVRRDDAVEREYRRGRVTQADLGGDAVREIAEKAKGTTDSGELQSLRLQADCYKWIAAKLAPKVYGATALSPVLPTVNITYDSPKALPGRVLTTGEPSDDYESPAIAGDSRTESTNANTLPPVSRRPMENEPNA